MLRRDFLKTAGAFAVTLALPTGTRVRETHNISLEEMYKFRPDLLLQTTFLINDIHLPCTRIDNNDDSKTLRYAPLDATVAHPPIEGGTLIFKSRALRPFAFYRPIHLCAGDTLNVSVTLNASNCSPTNSRTSRTGLR